MTIQEFPLAWRWTQSSHAVLPATALARMRPLSKLEAAEICELTKRIQKGSSVYSKAGDSAQRWLRSVQPDLAAAVFVSWSEDLAIETTWEIFTGYWNDFCYPSSDDVIVIPVAGDWRLFYLHHEQFVFIA